MATSSTCTTYLFIPKYNTHRNENLSAYRNLITTENFLIYSIYNIYIYIYICRHTVIGLGALPLSRSRELNPFKLVARPDVVPTRTCCGQSKSGKVSFKRSFFDGLHSFKRVGYWLSFLLMVAILTLRCGDVHPHPGPVSREKSDLCTVTPSATYPQCPLCLSVVRDTGALFQHINVSHISQRCFPDANFLSAHDRRLCSDCGEKRFAYCRRSLGCGRTRCRGKMVDARFSLTHLENLRQQMS